MKPMPAHHKEVTVFRSTIARGYGGDREIPAAGPGLWIIVAAGPSSVDLSKRPPPAMVDLIVAPARGGK